MPNLLDPLGLDDQKNLIPPPSGGQKTSYSDPLDPLGLGPEEKKPSYLEAAKVGFKGGLSGAMKMYEIPSRSILEKTGLAAPGTFGSELLKPSEEEEKRVGELGIPGEIVRGVAGLPGAFAKYGPLMAAAPESIFGTALLGGAEEAAEQLAAGKKLSPLEIVEQAITLGIFKGIEPLGRAARMGILAGTFSVPAFAQTYAQTKDLTQSLKSGIAPAIIGGGMGLMGGKRGEERPIPRPGEGEPLQIPTIPESRYQMGAGGYPIPEELPHPIVPYRPGGPMVDTGEFFQATSVPPRPPPAFGLPRPGEEHYGPIAPFWPDRTEESGLPHPPVPFEPRITPFRPTEAPLGPPEAGKPPTPTLTPPPEAKAPEAPLKPLTDSQMAIIRREAEKVGGVSTDLIKRWSGVGTKRAAAALEDLVNKGEIEGAGPDSKFPWKFKVPEPTPAAKEFYDAVGEITKRSRLPVIIKPSGQDLIDIVKKMGGLNPGDHNIDRKGLFESGMYGKAGLLRKSQKMTLDEMREDILAEARLNPNIGTDELKEMIESQLENRRLIAKAKGRGVEIPNINKMTEGELDEYYDQQYDRARTFRDDPTLSKEGLNYIGADTGVPPGVPVNHHFNIAEEAANKAGVPEATGATISTTDISPDNLKKAMAAKLEEFKASKPSPTRAGEQLLPRMRVGLEMKGAKEGAAPTLEGTPLAEAARKAELEKVQPKLPLGKKPPEVSGFDRETFAPAWDWLNKEGWRSGVSDDGKSFAVVAPDGIKTPLPDVSDMEPEAASVFVLNKGLRDQWLERQKGPKPPLGIGDSVVGETPKGDFKGVVAEVNPDGSVLIGSSDGKMIELPADKVSRPGKTLTVKGDDVGYTDSEGKFAEVKPGEELKPESPPIAEITTFKEFLASKGVDWPKSGNATDVPNYQSLFDEFNDLKDQLKPKGQKVIDKEADDYVRKIRNENKKTYAQKYLRWLRGGSAGDAPEAPEGLSAMAAQAVRMELNRLYPESEPEARMGAAPKEPLSHESVQGFANERLKILKNAPETEVVDTIADMPERLSNQLNENMRKGIKGVYDPMSKKIYLVREMLGSEEDVIKTIEHEAVGHYATEAYLGKEADPFYSRVYLKYGKSGLKDIAEERGFDLNTREGRINAAKEKVAQLAETGENPGLLQQLYGWIRAQLSKVFPDSKISDAEIQRVISNARKSLASGDFAVREAKIEALRDQVRRVTGLSPEQGFRPAQFSIAGKAKETGRAAYEEDIKPAGKGLFGAYEWIKKTVSPTSGVDVKDMDIMMKLLGEREMAKARVEYLTEKGIAELNKLSPREQVDLIDKIQTGYTFDELPANLREYARLHRWIEDSVLIKANEILSKSDRASTIAYLEGHVRNFWKVVPRGLMDEINRKGFEGLSRRPIEGTRAPLHHQYWTLKEGMANGGVPFTTNLLEATRLNYADTYKLLTAHDMWNAIGDIGHRKFVRFGEAIPEGFRHLDDRIANKYFPPKEAGRWVVEDNVGRILENYLSRDLVRENPALRGIMGIKNVTTALELGFSFFHASFISWETIASQIGLGMRKIWNQGMIKEGLKDIIEAPISPYKTFKIGQDIARLFKNPDEFIASTGGPEFFKMFPEGKEMLGDLFWGGGSVRMSESYRINSINTFKENLNSKNYIGAALRSIPALSQTIMKPLFETYIPSLKRAVFFKEFSNELVARQGDLLSGKITRPELARNTWTFVENRFGEMNFDNLWWNRTFKSGLQMMVRSVTWKLGNIRAYGKAVTGQSAEILSAMREGRMPKLTQEMAWFWGIAATTAAMASIAQYAFTGKAPEDWKDLIYPQTDQQGGRISLPTYMRDFFSATHSPVKYVSSSLAGWFGRFTDIIGNKDFYGTMIHDPNENVIMQRIDDLIHLAPLPFSIQSIKRMREEGAGPSRQIMGFIGATKAPYWIERTNAEQKASDLKALHLPIGGRTPEDFAKGQLLKNYAKRYQAAANKGEPTDDVMRELHSDIAAGKLRMQDLMRFRQRISREPLVNSVMNLPFKDVLEVWNVASTEERKKLYPILNRKFYGLRSPEDRALYLPKIRQITEEMR
jgi:hypothetical protein